MNLRERSRPIFVTGIHMEAWKEWKWIINKKVVFLNYVIIS